MRHPVMRAVLLVLCALLWSCQKNPAGKATDAKRAPGAAAVRPPPDSRGKTTWSKRVEVKALLDMDRVAGGKRFQGTWLILPDGKRVVVSYRPIPRYYRFIEKRVVATGRYFQSPPHVQQIGARHFQVESLALAPGETPHGVPPKRLPAPAVVTRRAELDKRAGRWVTVRGKLIRLRKKGTYWTRGEVRLGDGTTVVSAALRRRCAPLVGKQVTVIGHLRLAQKQAQPRYLLGQTAICKGRPPRCGVSDWPRRRGKAPE